MQISRVGPLDPGGEPTFQFQRTRPFGKPELFFFESPHEPFRVRVPFGIVIARERLRDAQRLAGLYKGEGGRLAPIVAHEGEAALLDALRELLIAGRAEGGRPVRGAGLEACLCIEVMGKSRKTYLTLPVEI